MQRRRRRLALLLLCAITRVSAGIAEDAQFLADICSTVSVPGTEPTFCSAPLTVANYCSSDEIVCSPSTLLISKLNITGLTGALPSTIGGVVGLESFCVTDSTLTAPIDATFAALPSLHTIEIRNSDLAAPLPDGAYPALEVLLYLAPEPIPAGIYPGRPLRELTVLQAPIDLSDLPVATLEYVQITATTVSGTIPRFDTAGPLREIILANNQGVASLGDNDSLFRVETLERVFFSRPGLVGAFPTSFTSPSRLNCLKVLATDLVGELNTETLRYATELEDLVLRSNSGNIVARFDGALCHTRKLRRLFTDAHRGEIPACLGELPNITSITVSSTGSCDPELGVVGTLHQSFLNTLQETEPSDTFFPNLQLSDVCLTGTIPELPFPIGELSPTLFSDIGSAIRIRNTQLRSPYPRWIRAILDASGEFLFQTPTDCLLDGNRFCHKPPVNPLDQQCSLTVDATTNVCGMCDEPDERCLDCKGVLNGPAIVDQCGVCGGSNACLDCASAINGTATYDACDVCAGDGTACVDCTGELFGSATYDLCDVCGGDSGSCLDCSGTPFGTLVYDICDVCGGAGGTCADCSGVVGGDRVLDVCGECVERGSVPQCYDCAGVPHGTAIRDRCLVCGGDGSSCSFEDDHHVLAAQLALDRYGRIVAIPIVLSIVAIVLACSYCYSAGMFGVAQRVERKRLARRTGRISVRKSRCNNKK